MVSALDHRAVAPRREKTDDARRKPKMPKGPGVHINVNFGGEAAERGRKVLEPAKNSRQTPQNVMEKNGLPDFDDLEDTAELQGKEAQKVQAILKGIADDYDNDNRPTRPIPGRNKLQSGDSREEQMLSRDSDVSRLTTSFAPPPPISAPIVEEPMATEVRDNVVPINVAKSWVPPRKRKEEKKRPSIIPAGKAGWSLDDQFEQSIVKPAIGGRPGSR